MHIWLIIILSVIALCAICSIISVLVYRYKSASNELDYTKQELLRYRTVMSMIEYFYRDYVEGSNPYTVLKDISDLLKLFER